MLHMRTSSKSNRRLVLAMLSFVVVILLVVTLSSVYLIMDKMEASAAASAQYQLENLTETLSIDIQADENAILYLADSLDLSRGKDAIQEKLLNFQEDYQLLNVFFLDEQNQNSEPVKDFLAGSEQWPFDPLTLSGFSDAFQGKYGVWETDYGAPVVRNGVKLGTVYACIPLSKYGKNSRFTYYGEQGMAYMFDTNTHKMVILPSAPSDVTIYMQDINQLFIQIGLTQEELDAQVYPAIARKDTMVIHGILNGQRIYCTLMDLNNHDGWYICGIVPAAVLQKEAGTILWLLVGVLVSMGLTMLIILYFIIHWVRQKTQQKLEQLRQAEMQKMIYDTVGDASDTVLCVFDWESAKFEVVFHNISRILGIDADQLLSGQPALLSPLLNCAEEGLYDRVVCGEITGEAVYKFSYDHPLQHEIRDIRLTLKHLNIQNRECLMFVAEDITKDVKIQASLHAALESANQANLAKSEFLSRMSHDIRTPINAIIGMREIAARNLNDPERLKDCLYKIELSSTHLLGLVNDILDLSKIESGKLSLYNEPFHLHECLSSVVTIVQTQASFKKQSFQIDTGSVIHDDLIGDETRLKQILINLLSNAVKYTQEGGEISLTVQEKQGEHNGYCTCFFLIKDNGVGISPEFLEKIGHPFEQESNVFHKSELGSGLGLSIVKNLVALMGGVFSIESEKGVGTTVCVEISLQQNDTNCRPDSREQISDTCSTEILSGKRVLVVEDNELNREIAVELLAAEQMLVETAQDGLEAVEKFRNSPAGYFSLILMDLQMPRMDGYTATREIRSLNHKDAAHIPIIAMTANAFSEDVMRCRQAGMNGHLSKPIAINKMYACIAKILRETELPTTETAE